MRSVALPHVTTVAAALEKAGFGDFVAPLDPRTLIAPVESREVAPLPDAEQRSLDELKVSILAAATKWGQAAGTRAALGELTELRVIARRLKQPTWVPSWLLPKQTVYAIRGAIADIGLRLDPLPDPNLESARQWRQGEVARIRAGDMSRTLPYVGSPPISRIEKLGYGIKPWLAEIDAAFVTAAAGSFQQTRLDLVVKLNLLQEHVWGRRLGVLDKKRVVGFDDCRKLVDLIHETTDMRTQSTEMINAGATLESLVLTASRQRVSDALDIQRAVLYPLVRDQQPTIDRHDDVALLEAVRTIESVRATPVSQITATMNAVEP